MDLAFPMNGDVFDPDQPEHDGFHPGFGAHCHAILIGVELDHNIADQAKFAIRIVGGDEFRSNAGRFRFTDRGVHADGEGCRVQRG